MYNIWRTTYIIYVFNNCINHIYDYPKSIKPIIHGWYNIVQLCIFISLINFVYGLYKPFQILLQWVQPGRPKGWLIDKKTNSTPHEMPHFHDKCFPGWLRFSLPGKFHFFQIISCIYYTTIITCTATSTITIIIIHLWHLCTSISYIWLLWVFQYNFSYGILNVINC